MTVSVLGLSLSLRSTAGLIALVAVVTALVVVVLRAGGGTDTPSALAQAVSAQQETLQQFGDLGGVLYLRDDVYRRQGPAAEAIRKGTNGVWYLPERYTNELWVTAEPGGRIINIRGAVKDLSGASLQEIKTVDGQVQTTDMASGETSWYPLPSAVSDAKARLQQSMTDLATWTTVDSSEETVLLQKEMPLPEATVKDSNGTGYRLPYSDDIAATQAFQRVEVRTDAPVSLRWMTVLKDASGNEIVVEDKVRAAFQIESPRQ